MSPPISLSSCPPEIRQNPLPGDRCTDPRAPVRSAADTFRRISLVAELPAFGLRSGSSASVDFRYRSGVYGIFRPHALLHAGLGVDTDWASELTVMGRAGATIPFHPLRMYGMDLSLLAGLRQVFAQSHDLGGADTPVSGSLFAFGGEASLRFQMWHEFSFVLPYFRFLLSPPAGVSTPAGPGNLPWSWEMQFGIGLSFDFLPGSN